jgi:uncharacterized protein (TIGR00730 family)
MSDVFFKEEQRFLQGPRARWRELKYTLGVVMQFLKGFRAMHFIGPCITVFGSARFASGHLYYELARQVAAEISKMGFTIMTGGGGGIMEAANRGAKEAGGLSIGCNIVLPKEQRPNSFLDKYVNIEYFFVRKELLRKYSFAFIILPGGFGTLDEFFETLTLIQTHKMKRFPVVVMGVNYHQELMAYLAKMADQKTINAEDLQLILCTDSVTEAVEHVQKFAMADEYLMKMTRPRPLWILGEKK